MHAPSRSSKRAQCRGQRSAGLRLSLSGAALCALSLAVAVNGYRADYTASASSTETSQQTSTGSASRLSAQVGGGLGTQFEMSTKFIILQVITMLTIVPGNLLPLQMLFGQKGSKNGVAAFCNGHLLNWGIQNGVMSGDRYDSFCVLIVLPLKLASWAPYPLIQLYAAMASTFWFLNMVCINMSNQAHNTRFSPIDLPAPIIGYFVVSSNLEMFTVLMRGRYFIDQDTQLTILVVWFWLWVFYFARTTTRIFRLSCHPIYCYMQELSCARGAHVGAGNNWSGFSDEPEGFDPTVDTAKALEHLQDRLAVFQGWKPDMDLSTADGVNRMIDAFLASECVSMSVWVLIMLVIVLVGVAVPLVL